jgi:hypothetical protein
MGLPIEKPPLARAGFAETEPPRARFRSELAYIRYTYMHNTYQSCDAHLKAQFRGYWHTVNHCI